MLPKGWEKYLQGSADKTAEGAAENGEQEVADNNQKNSDSGGGNKPAAEQDKTALAIEALRKNYEAAQRDHAKHDGKTLFWARVTGIGVGIYTLLTLVIVG